MVRKLKLQGLLSRFANPLGGSVLIYGVAFAVAGATPLLLLPFLTKYLTPQEFGEVTSFLILSALLGNIAGLSAHGFVSVRYFKVPAGEFNGVLSASLVTVVATHVVAALLVLLLYPVIATMLGLSLKHAVAAVAAALVLSINGIFLAVFQSAGKPMLYLRCRLVQACVEIALCVALVLLLEANADARVYSYVVAIALSASVGLLYGVRQGIVRPELERKHVIGLATFGIPMVPHIVAGSAIVYLDRVVVASVLGADSLGIYMVATQIGMVMMVLIEPLNKALAPWLFGALAKNDDLVRQRIVANTYRLYGALVFVGTIVGAIAYLGFDLFIDSEYGEARKLIPWTIAGFVLQGMYYSVVNYLFYAERTGQLSIMSGVAAVVGCIVSYTMTSTMGLLGAGISFALNATTLFLLVWLAAARAVPMPWFRTRVVL